MKLARQFLEICALIELCDQVLGQRFVVQEGPVRDATATAPVQQRSAGWFPATTFKLGQHVVPFPADALGKGGVEVGEGAPRPPRRRVGEPQAERRFLAGSQVGLVPEPALGAAMSGDSGTSSAYFAAA